LNGNSAHWARTRIIGTRIVLGRSLLLNAGSRIARVAPLKRMLMMMRPDADQSSDVDKQRSQRVRRSMSQGHWMPRRSLVFAEAQSVSYTTYNDDT